MKLHREVLPARHRLDPRTLEQRRLEIQRERNEREAGRYAVPFIAALMFATWLYQVLS